jgi:predicted DNA-binding protein (MmcQ/YjbR family)
MAEHPQVVDPDDPVVERLREICMAYPEAAEVQAWGRPSFRAGKKVFVLVGSMDQPHSFLFKPSPDDHLAYKQDPRVWVPPYWGPSGWLAIDLDDPAVEWDEVVELIDSSYRQVALVRQLKALDARTPAP